ncbi:MAG: O-antigen ligase family protein [Bacteroidales bacterium]|nr:O-antigen ligase family protein [Bacteroidales bacterium]
MFTKEQILNCYIPCFILGLLFITPFTFSNNLYDGIVVSKELWFFGVVASMLLFWTISLLFNKGGFAVNLNITDIFLLLFYAWCLIRAIFTPYTPFLHNHKLQVLTGVIVVYFFVKSVIKDEDNKNTFGMNAVNSFVISFLIFLFILSAFLQAIYGLLQLYGVYPSLHNIFKITGTFSNPAPYALYLAGVFPLALGKVLFNQLNERKENKANKEKIVKRRRSLNPLSFQSFTTSLNFFSFLSCFIPSFIYYLSLSTVIAILLVLPATMIRAAWLGVLVGSFVVLQCRFQYLQHVKQLLNNFYKRIIAVILAIAVITLLGMGLYHIKRDSANGKLFIWEVTLGKIAEKPLFGYGLGRFEAEYNNWQAEYFRNHPEEMVGPKSFVAGNTKYAFNEFFEIASEVGIVGLFLFLTVIVSIFYFIPTFFHSFTKNDFFNETSLFSREKYLLAVFSLCSLLISAAISFPFYSLPTLILFFTLIAIATSNCSTWCYNLKMNTFFIRFSLACLSLALALPYLLGLQKTPYYIYWNEANYFYAITNYSNANIDYKEITASFFFNGTLWQQYGKSLQMDGNNKESVKVLEKAGNFTSDYILYTTLGDAYKGIKQYGKAEAAYQHAIYMEPHKFYPHYLLAKLYFETGQNYKAREIAEDILNKEVKVPSRAIEEIRTEMKKILSKYCK